ncbi:MAG: hypothetical protein ABSD75_18110 [Terriglobales bacterium]
MTPVSCAAGQYLYGNNCGAQYWFNDCRALAAQLARLQQQMAGSNDPGVSLRRRLLEEQYERCQTAYQGVLLTGATWLPLWDY